MGASANGAMFSDVRAAGHAHAPGHGRVSADVHVVRDLNQIVEFDAIFQDGVTQGPSVHAGVGANFHIVADADRAELFDLVPAALHGRKAKAVGANDHATVQDTAITQDAVVANGDVGRQACVGTDAGASPDDGMGANFNAIAQHGIGLNHGQGTNGDALPQHGAGIDHGRRMDATRPLGPELPGPPLGQPGKIQVGVVRDDGRTASDSLFTHGRRCNDAARLGGQQLRFVLRVRQKRNAAGVGCIEGCNPVDQPIGWPQQFAAQGGHQLTQADLGLGCGSAHLAEAPSALMTRSVMSTRGLANTASCRIRSYFSWSKICLTTLLARSRTPASSSFLRWLRSS